MGLSEPRKRMKLSHDPNNTNWTGNTDNFGHRIMQAHGWTPGDFLGAKNAKHAEHYTAANASHIRVFVKDDNLGLGAKIGSGVGHGECTGLDAFKDLLGRLNGKDEDEIEKEQKSREDLKRAIYTERKWGSIRFVQGGFLVGDKILDLIEGEAERVRKLKEGDSSDDTKSSDEEEKAVKVEKSKKSKKRKVKVEDDTADVIAVKVKKSKKRKAETDSDEKETEVDDVSDNSDKKRRKKEKREKKERKELKRALKAGLTEEARKEEKKVKKDKRKSLYEIPEYSGTTTPSTPTVDSGRSTPMMSGRHAVRSRNIAQKRLASMDVAALNQIFMIKAPS